MLTLTNLTHRFTTGRYGQDIDIIGIHTMEAPEGPQTAENIANYFKTVKASSHWCVDNNSRVRVVKDEDTAWTLPGANTRSLNIELAGYARQSPAAWADQYSTDMLEIAALCCAEWCKKFNIPIRHLTFEQIRDGEKGFAGHVDVNAVYRKSTHWDPGPHFPWNYFLGRVAAHLKAINSGTTVIEPKDQGFSFAYIAEIQKKLNKLGAKLLVDGVLGPITVGEIKAFQKRTGLVVDGVPGPITNAALDKAVAPIRTPNIRDLQRALRTLPDNQWGSVTDRHFVALRSASQYHGNKFPYGVRFAQRVVGTIEDGNWGRKSWAAHTSTVKAVQNELKELGFYKGAVDGTWAAMTDAAYKAARSKFRR